MKKLQREGGNLVTLFQEQVRLHPNKLAFVLVDDRQMTFREVDEFSNQVNDFNTRILCRIVERFSE